MGAGAGLAQGANDMKEKSSLLHETASKPLLEYLTAASLLATNHEDYRKAVNVSESDYNDLKTVPGLELDQLLTVQNDIKDHCSKFKDTTYPAIIKLASDVHRYARKVGGKPQSSYYGNLVTQLQLLEDAQAKNDTATVDTCKKHIFSLCDVAIKEAAGIAASSDAAAKALDHFATQCDQDKKNLGDRKNAISRALDGLDSEKGKGGLIKQRRDEIEEQGKLWWKNYREFVIATTAAATSVLWLLIPCYGLIIMPIAAGVGSEEAKKLHKAMDDCNTLIEKDGKEIERYMRLSHDINVVSTRTKSLYDLIEPAKQVVLRNKGTWEAIASDVSGIKTAVEGNKAETPDSYMGGISVDSLILLWNDVAQLADDFRLNAYTTAEVKDTDEAELKKQLDSIVRDHGEEPK